MSGYVVRSVSPLSWSYIIGAPYLVITLIILVFTNVHINQSLASFSPSFDFVEFMWHFHSQVSFSIAIQPRLTMFGPHIDHGGYKNVHVTWPWPYFYSLPTLLNLDQVFVKTGISVSLISIAIQSRLTIFDPHNDDRGLYIS